MPTWGAWHFPAPFSAPCPSRRQCQQDTALWETLHLDQRVSLDELLNISQVGAKGGRAVPGRAPHLGDTVSRSPSPRQYTEEISAAFEEVNITLSPISLLSESQRDLLLNASRAAQPPNFTHTLQQVGGLWGQPGVGSGGPGARCGAAVPSTLLLGETLGEVQAPFCPTGMGCVGVKPLSQPHLVALSLPFPAGSDSDPGKPPGSGHGAGAAGGQSGERQQHPGATATLSPKLRGCPLGASRAKGGLPLSPCIAVAGGTADCSSF